MTVHVTTFFCIDTLDELLSTIIDSLLYTMSLSKESIS